MYYTIYKITNQINGKIYIGSHKTNDLNDGYMGSGKYLKYAQEKYGIENFTKEILFVFDTPELMYAKEAEIVNEEFISEQNTYNIKVGGFGGFDYINANNKGVRNFKDPEIHRKAVESQKTRRKTVGLSDREIARVKACSERMKWEFASGIRKPGFLGRSHTEETREQMKQSAKGKHTGEKNSQFGTMWITNGKENRKIKKDETIPEGWSKGRIC